MDNTTKMALIRAIFNLIFQGKQTMSINTWTQAPKPVGFENTIIAWVPRGFVNNTLRGVDAQINVGNRVLSLRFLEQNPNKTDHNGNLKPLAVQARSGQQIMWVIDRNVDKNGFLGRMQNGQWIPSEMRAYSPANAQAAVASPAGFSTNEVPDMPSNMSIPEYVIREMDDVPDDVMDSMIDNIDEFYHNHGGEFDYDPYQ